MTPLIGTKQHWKSCVGCLTGHPVFVLGNGPTLPDDLSALDGFFTVGVNRIWWSGYDPTVVLWTDVEIERDVSAPRDGAILYQDSESIVFIRDEINYDKSRANDLEPFGTFARPVNRPLNDPSMIGGTGSTGTAAAFWAMGLGCRPVYILGMSSSYTTDIEGEEITSFYGVNRYHSPLNKRRMDRALNELLAWEHVYPVQDQESLNKIAKQWKPMARERQWYSERFRACFHSGQLAATSG